MAKYEKIDEEYSWLHEQTPTRPPERIPGQAWGQDRSRQQGFHSKILVARNLHAVRTRRFQELLPTEWEVRRFHSGLFPTRLARRTAS
jgi:hypothetical protein